MAVGRRPLSDGLGLADVGVTVDAKTGKVPVDARFRTNVATISAIGDLIEGPMLAHKAEDEGIAFGELLAGKVRSRRLQHGSRRHLHLARAGQRRSFGGASEGARPELSRRQVPVRRQRPSQGDG